MADKLVIVESPAKARTIRKYLGAEFSVRASMGHIRDLPKRKLGVDVEAGFHPSYTVLKSKRDVVKELRQYVEQAREIFLATDPDREGEAIAWHVLQATKPKGKPVHRVIFHEVTKPAIQEAFRQPRQVDMQLVEAQQARRILDRLVGYQISPLLWEKVRRGLSAGRVQSVAVRLVVEREQEIENFVPQEYWTVEADLAKIRPEGQERQPADIFRAVLYSVRGKRLGKFGLKTEADAQSIVDDLEGAAYHVLAIKRRNVKRRPRPPYITSTLQQEASRKLGFNPKRTMRVAQQLYEGIDLGDEGSVGLITYMRTDSTHVSPVAQQEARDYIASKWGEKYLPAKPPVYKKKVAQAQEAHEAIRPTSAFREPEAIRKFLNKDQFRLYDLIWRRFLASQMAPAIFDRTTVSIAAGPPGQEPAKRPYVFRATGSVIVFPGFLAVYREELEEGQEDKDAEKVLPPLEEGELLDLVKLFAEQHFTKPPPRFSEATLIKELEKRGIGRPSTYASIVATIQERHYVERVEPRRRKSPLRPTELGILVNELLVAHFPDILDYGFTSQMETRLDQIASGERQWVPVLSDFYGTFSEELARAKEGMRDVKQQAIPTDIVCEECGRPMVIRWGRRGEFLACSGYPECKNSMDFSRSESGEIVPQKQQVAPVEHTCELCGSPMVVKQGRYGPFLACTGYPKCKNTISLSKGKDGELIPHKPEGTTEVCEKCGSPMVVKQGRYGPFLACSAYPKCKNTKPLGTGVQCPKCKQGELVQRRSRRAGQAFYACNRYPECDFSVRDRPVKIPCPLCEGLLLEGQQGEVRCNACGQSWTGLEELSEAGIE
jgi:DNA topoisomerase-1